MRFIDLKGFGAAEQMFVAEGEIPSPQAGEILIQVQAAGVNRPDIVQRQGHYPPPAGASPILGLEVAGTVAAVGEGVDSWRLGEAVCALTNGGGYAEYVAVPARQCLPIPAGFSAIKAAALPETFFTVWSNLFIRAELKPSELLLVHGGAGGIGGAAILLAKAFGAQVMATASGEKLAHCRNLGADLAIDYRREDFVEQVKNFSGGRGADVILDMVGGDYVARNIKAAAVDGRIVNIAFMAGSQVELNLMPLMLKRLTLTGSTLRAQSNEAKAEIAGQLRERVWPKLASGEIAVPEPQVFAFAEVARAHRLMEAGEHRGKLVLRV